MEAFSRTASNYLVFTYYFIPLLFKYIVHINYLIIYVIVLYKRFMPML